MRRDGGIPGGFGLGLAGRDLLALVFDDLRP
jgi:hypothetical protein